MNRKGQFSIIAALLVAVILIAAVVTTYSAIRYNTLEGSPQILSAIDEVNLAMKQILGFTVGYYGATLKVTGNVTYAQAQAKNYLINALGNISEMRPEWGMSFNVTEVKLNTNWFMPASYSQGSIKVSYNLTGLDIENISYETEATLNVCINSVSSDGAHLEILKDNNESLIDLGIPNFKFYRYVYSNSSWDLVEPVNVTSYSNGTYLLGFPSGVSWDAFTVQVEDTRGLIVTASSFSSYNISLTWDAKYSTFPTENVIVELLQNGTMRWLGQNLNLTAEAKPIPPIPVRSIRVNQTINGVSREVPFQVEDWASEYRVPLSLTSNASIFNNRMMIVFLVNYPVSEVTIWWDGRDIANQTSYSIVNNGLSVNATTKTLSNGNLTVQLDFSDGSFRVTSTKGSVTSRATLMRINTKVARYGSAQPTYAVTSGVVRLIVHHEVEWGSNANDQLPNCSDVYAHIVLTLPANATYYTYQLRFIFINSSLSRTVSDFCPISLSTSTSITNVQTENGTTSGYPNVSTITTGSSSYYNFSDGKWAHHWSQFTWSSGTKGAGIMFTDTANQLLYIFDNATNKTGAVKADYSNKKIELCPVTNSTSLPTSAFDIAWHGAVVTFDGTTPIYRSSDQRGLWLLVEYPPTATVTTAG